MRKGEIQEENVTGTGMNVLSGNENMGYTKAGPVKA